MRERDRERDRETERDWERLRETERDWERQRETERDRERQRERERERDWERERETETSLYFSEWTVEVMSLFELLMKINGFYQLIGWKFVTTSSQQIWTRESMDVIFGIVILSLY